MDSPRQSSIEVRGCESKSVATQLGTALIITCISSVSVHPNLLVTSTWKVVVVEITPL